MPKGVYERKPRAKPEYELPEGYPPESELPSGRKYMVSDHKIRFQGRDTLIFEPGVPVSVRREDQPGVLQFGARALYGDTALATNDEPDPKKDPTSEEYRAAVRAAAEDLVALNDPTDFGANGKPYVAAWDRILGWTPLASVRDEIWDDVKNAAAFGD